MLRTDNRDELSLFFVCFLQIITMFPPHLMGRPQKKKELIPEHLKMPLRVAGFVVAVIAMIKFGEQLDMPEPTRL